MQLTSAFVCTELIAFMCSVPPAWQVMQRSLTSLAETFWKVKILVTSPPPATCAAPGPWQPSQPWCAGPPLVSSVVFQCGLFSQLLYASSWQALQVSDPT